MKNCIIVDLDGTVCNHEERIKLAQEKDGFNWDIFMDAENIKKDTPKTSIIDIVNKYYDSSTIIIITGRGENRRFATCEWLQEYSVGYDFLYMRKENDERHDTVFKQEIYNEFIKDTYDVLFVLEDRNSVVKMWRELGLTCLQVMENDF